MSLEDIMDYLSAMSSGPSDTAQMPSLERPVTWLWQLNLLKYKPVFVYYAQS